MSAFVIVRDGVGTVGIHLDLEEDEARGCFVAEACVMVDGTRGVGGDGFGLVASNSGVLRRTLLEPLDKELVFGGATDGVE